MVSLNKIFAPDPLTTVERDALPPVPNGSNIYNLNTLRPQFTTDGGTTWLQLATSDDIPTSSEKYGEMFFQGNASETVIVTISTPVKVNATYSSGELQDFTQAAGTLTYTGVDASVFYISASLGATLNLSSGDATIVVFINGSPVVKSQQEVYLGDTSPAIHPISVQFLANLTTNDTVEIFVQNDTDTENILVQDLNLSAVSFAGGSAGGSEVVITWDGSATPVNVTAGANIDITAGNITTTAEPNIVTQWDGSFAPVAITAGTEMDIAGGVVSTTAEQNVVSLWDGAATPVNVTGGTDISITSGAIDYTGAGEANVVTSWDGSSSPLAVTAGTGIDITGGVIAATGSPSGGNVTRLATVIVPVENMNGLPYPVTMWNTLSGSPIIQPFSFPVNDTIEIDVVGTFRINIQDTILGSENFFNIVFGSVQTFTSSNIYSGNTTTTNTPFQFKFRITRLTTTQLSTVGSGFIVTHTGAFQQIFFSGGVAVSTYDESVAETIDVNITGNVFPGNVGDLYGYQCWSLNINQYSL